MDFLQSYYWEHSDWQVIVWYWRPLWVCVLQLWPHPSQIQSPHQVEHYETVGNSINFKKAGNTIMFFTIILQFEDHVCHAIVVAMVSTILY